jgi:hypothetical protein
MVPTPEGYPHRNDLLYVIQESLIDKPENSASEDNNDDYRIHCDLSIAVKCDSLYSMDSELQV